MFKYAILFLLVGIGDLFAASWRPTERLLYAIRSVESSHGRFTYGDEGRSLGDFQMSEGAWLDVSTWRKAQGLPTYNYGRHVLDRKINRLYAADYLTIIYEELQKKLSRSPSSAEIYAAYNMGLGSFAHCRYQLARVNPVTAKKCQQIKQMMKSPK
jgi:hypothetical protein